MAGQWASEPQSFFCLYFYIPGIIGMTPNALFKISDFGDGLMSSYMEGQSLVNWPSLHCFPNNPWGNKPGLFYYWKHIHHLLMINTYQLFRNINVDRTGVIVIVVNLITFGIHYNQNWRVHLCKVSSCFDVGRVLLRQIFEVGRITINAYLIWSISSAGDLYKDLEKGRFCSLSTFPHLARTSIPSLSLESIS